MFSSIAAVLVVIAHVALSDEATQQEAPKGADFAWSEARTTAAAKWIRQRLDLDVHIDPAEGTLYYTGEMTLRLESDASNELALFLNTRKPAFGFERVDGPAGSTVEINCTVGDSPEARVATITLAEPASRGDTVAISFQCRLFMPSYQAIVQSDVVLASWVEGWHPTVPPDDETGLASRMTAPGRTRFHLPSGWDVASIGEPIEKHESGGEVVVVWKDKGTGARSFVAAPYHVARHAMGDREVGVYLLTASGEAAKQQAETLSGALQALEKHLGPYPYDSYAIAEVPRDAVDWYASSEQGFIMARSDAFDKGPNLPLFAHEMSHGWWGNLVNQAGPGSIVCSESLAQYCAVLAIEALEGPEEATKFLRFSRYGYHPMQCAFGYFAMLRAKQDAPLSTLSDEVFAHNLSDAKGHWVYHMLRGRVGDDVFFGVLRGLLRDYAGKSMTLQDVRQAFIAASPADAKVERFFEDWLDRGGAPVIEVEWSTSDEQASQGTQTIDVVLKQTQSGEPYSLQVDIAVQGTDGELRHTVTTEDREVRTQLASPGTPHEVLVDPDHQLLIWDEAFTPQR